MKQHECREKQQYHMQELCFSDYYEFYYPLRSFIFCFIVFFSPSKHIKRLSMRILDLLHLLTGLANYACLKLICPEITRFEFFMLTQNSPSQFDLWYHYHFKGLGLVSSPCCLPVLTLPSNLAFVVLDFTLMVPKDCPHCRDTCIVYRSASVSHVIGSLKHMNRH